jgi:uncharacterized protein (TIGR02217 family)
VSGFHDVLFPPDISYGASGGPGYLTTVVTTIAGYERRNSSWADSRGRWDVAHGLRNRDHVASLIAFFRARRGRAYGFRFKDWTDYQASAQVLGVGVGARKTFQLVRNYASGGVTATRTISKPVAGTVTVYRDGGVAASGVTINTVTGLVTLSAAPAAGVIVTADYEFHVPVRFDSDQMNITIETYQLGTWAQVPIIEVRA